MKTKNFKFLALFSLALLMFLFACKKEGKFDLDPVNSSTKNNAKTLQSNEKEFRFSSKNTARFNLHFKGLDSLKKMHASQADYLRYISEKFGQKGLEAAKGTIDVLSEYKPKLSDINLETEDTNTLITNFDTYTDRVFDKKALLGRVKVSPNVKSAMNSLIDKMEKNADKLTADFLKTGDTKDLEHKIKESQLSILDKFARNIGSSNNLNKIDQTTMLVAAVTAMETVKKLKVFNGVQLEDAAIKATSGNKNVAQTKFLRSFWRSTVGRIISSVIIATVAVVLIVSQAYVFGGILAASIPSIWLSDEAADAAGQLASVVIAIGTLGIYSQLSYDNNTDDPLLSYSFDDNTYSTDTNYSYYSSGYSSSYYSGYSYGYNSDYYDSGYDSGYSYY
jgi:hypothetical protein